MLSVLHEKGGVIRMVTLTSEPIGVEHSLRALDHVYPATQGGSAPDDLAGRGGSNGTNSHLCTQIRMLRDPGTSRDPLLSSLGSEASEVGHPLRALDQAGAVTGGELTPDTCASHTSFEFSLECPIPTNARGVRFLLCLTNWLERYIPAFDVKIRPLILLLTPGRLWEWREEHDI